MMDAAYFTGRKELLEFFNNLLDLNLTKIEQTASGAIACQITEYIFAGSIPMSKVNWGARSDYEFVQNYKLLQNAFTKNRVQRHVDVDKLIRAKYQDNLEFCQWLKAFYDQTAAQRDDYDPVAVRLRGKGGKQYNAKMGNSGGGGAARPRPTAAPKAAATHKAAAERFARPLRDRTAANGAAPPQKKDASSAVADAELMIQNKELTVKVEDLEQAILDTEKERDFYFEKLRHVEIMLQVHQEKGEESDPNHLIDNVFKMLYATAEDKLTVNEEGEVVGVDEVNVSFADSV